MALNINNRRVEDLVARQAALTGESKVETVLRALEERQARLELQRAQGDDWDRVMRIMNREIWPALPAAELGRRLTREEEDAILGYSAPGRVILDTSAIIAILFREAEAVTLLERLWAADVRAVGAPTLVETGIVLTSRAGETAMALLHHFLEAFNVVTVAFDVVHYRDAVAAYNEFGRGRHPADLNFGDCLSYATARVTGLPLLYVVEDFSRTDIRPE